MELTKGFVQHCNKPSVLREFLLQAMDQNEKLEKDNKVLKEQRDSFFTQATQYKFNEVGKELENRNLRRALWIARAKRAIEKIAWFKLWNASISTMDPEDGARQEFDKWKKALGKFLKKAEEYK